MAGRHASSRRRRSWPRRLFALITAVVLVAVGVALANAFLEQRAATCEQAPDLVVAADPAIAPALSEFADGYQRTAPAVEGMCTPIEVTPLTAAEVASGIGSSVRADMWVPDSSLWAQQATTEGVALDVGQPLAMSPLVVVAPRPLAEQLGWPDAQLSWDAVLDTEIDTEIDMTIADPTTTSEGLGTLLTVAAVVGGEPENRTRLVQAMSGVARSTVPSIAAAYEQVDADPAQAPLFTATEQSVVLHNTTSPASLVAALYPAEGTVVFDYPAIRVTTAATTAVKAEAAEAFEAALHDPEAVEVLQDAGFRAPDGTPREGAGVVDGIRSAPPDALPAADPAQAAEILRLWAALSLDSQMLAVVDVSGSMNEQAEGGGTRIELTRDAALGALGLFPASSSIGLWAFSVDLDPPDDHVELVRLGPLSEQIGSRTRQEALVAAAQTLPDRVGGGTGLYDTVLAAFRTVRSAYDPARINSVVVLTDGVDRDDPDSIGLDTLLTTLRTEFDPARPVSVIMIGISADADHETLAKISAITGAKSYQVLDPKDMQQVFFDAMIQRQCRPNC
jgi:Ca-activated chloride channel family protein